LVVGYSPSPSKPPPDAAPAARDPKRAALAESPPYAAPDEYREGAESPPYAAPADDIRAEGGFSLAQESPRGAVRDPEDEGFSLAQESPRGVMRDPEYEGFSLAQESPRGAVRDPEDEYLAERELARGGEYHDSQDSNEWNTPGGDYTGKGKGTARADAAKQRALAALTAILPAASPPRRVQPAAAVPQPTGLASAPAPPVKVSQGSWPDAMAWLRANYDDTQVGR